MAILACLEKVLMETGADYNLVMARLQVNDFILVDCCDNTEYLRNVLKEVFGEKSNVLIDKVIEYLENFDEEEEIRIFLEKLKSNSDVIEEYLKVQKKWTKKPLD